MIIEIEFNVRGEHDGFAAKRSMGSGGTRTANRDQYPYKNIRERLTECKTKPTMLFNAEEAKSVP